MKMILKSVSRLGRSAVMGCLLVALFPFHASSMEQNVANSLGMSFVLIQTGSFTMGSPPEEQDRRYNEMPHEVTISRPFYIQTSQVTVSQWRAVMGSSLFFRKKGADNMPVTEVSWEDCMEFINRLNSRNDGTYRLPTEAEWEYACKGGKASVYGWGNMIDCSKAMYSNNTLKSADCIKTIRSRGWPSDGPAPVMSYEPNAWGLYDMAGNVWEWCSDWFAPYPKGAAVDPQGPSSGSERVRRGGSWYGPGDRCRCANRNFSHPANRYDTTGFRLVRVAD